MHCSSLSHSGESFCVQRWERLGIWSRHYRHCSNRPVGSGPSGPSNLWKLHKASRKTQFQTASSRREALFSAFCPTCCSFCKPKDGWYDKFFAYSMATGMQSYEDAVTPFKVQLLSQAASRVGQQKILEVGIGAGPNLQYLVQQMGSENLHVTGIDPNPYMFEYAQESARAAGLASDALDLQIGVVESLPVETESLDTVICTLVLCSVPDVAAAVKEMRRVLKPGGRAFFLEHVIASRERPLLQAAQRVLSPVQQLLADGCHLNRNPVAAIQAAGFSSLEVESFDVPGMGPIAPHISAVATA